MNITIKILKQLGFIAQPDDSSLFKLKLTEQHYPKEGYTYLEIKKEGAGKWSIYLSFEHGVYQCLPISKYEHVKVDRLKRLIKALGYNN